jgi:hypothetical protein
MRLVGALAAVALLVVPTGLSAPPPLVSCQSFPPLPGSYFRYDDHSWELAFNADCTYEATQHGNVEGGGNYTEAEMGIDTRVGTIVLSDDHACRDPGMQDLPTPYDFAYERGVLMLAPQGGIAADLCVNAKGEGRAQELAGHGGWIREVAGRLRLTLKGAKKGSFKASGVIGDRGSFKVTRSKVTKGVKRATLRFSGTQGTFSMTERVKKRHVTWSLAGNGAGGYHYLTGGGTGVAVGSRQLLNGDVSN